MFFSVLKSIFLDGDPTGPFGEPPEEEVGDNGELTHNFEPYSSEVGTDGSFVSPPGDEGNQIRHSGN